MAYAFIIMQIGNPELEIVFSEAILPAIKSSGLEPRRVDKHNKGGLLKSEIVNFIEGSDIIVADLTNERPNVYLEVGYAMGLDKFKNLVLTVQEDHFPESPNYKKGGPRVHFDLSGYDILRWNSKNLSDFKIELEKRIRRRLTLLTPSDTKNPSFWDELWINNHREVATKGLVSIGRTGFMEVRCTIHPPKPTKSLIELNNAAKVSNIDTFGWPIAAYIETPEMRPKPRSDGIIASIKPESNELFDYWSIRRNGDFYFLGSLFEDESKPNQIFYNTRIVRVTESIMYLIRLYDNLGIDRSTKVSIAVKHGGLKDRGLSSIGRRTHFSEKTEENEVESIIDTTIDRLDSQLVQCVIDLLSPLFMVFQFKEFHRELYENIVNKFVGGVVS